MKCFNIYLIISCLSVHLVQSQALMQPKSLKPDTLRTIQLKEVKVFGMTIERFKQTFMALELPPKPVVKLDLPPPEKFRQLSADPWSGGLKWQSKVGPFTYFWRKWSRFANNERKYNAKVAYDKKFSREWVSKITGLKDAHLSAFLRYCRPPKELVLEGTEYDLVLYIHEYLAPFLAQQKAKT
jgi:hypothetical protein